MTAAVLGRGLREQLLRGCRAYMEACADPTMARILADAPAVLGIEACRALDAAACVPLLAERLRPGRGGGRRRCPGIPAWPPPCSWASSTRLAGLIAATPHDRDLRARVGATVDAFVAKLFG